MKKNLECIVRIAAAVATIITVLVFANKRNKKEDDVIEGDFEEVID